MKGKLFISPTFDELEEVALDPHGDPRRLSEAQLKSVRQNGEFVVNSIHFPGQTHVWRLSEVLQKVCPIFRFRQIMFHTLVLSLLGFCLPLL